MTGDAPRAKRFPAQWSSTGRAATPGGTARNPLRPQALLHQAAQDAARHVVPTGLGLDNSPMRERMVARLRSEGITAVPLLAAFAAVQRHRFVDTALAIQAYEDTSLPIGLGQTISKPSVVARQLQWLFEGANASRQGHLGRTLEIGTGCGYQTALLARLAPTIISIERLQPLHQMARRHLDALGVPGVRLVHGDGRLGHAPNAPYDSIVAAAGGEHLPPAWTEQLAIGGRLVAPMHDAASGGQVLLVIDRRVDGLHRRLHDAVHFVPLKSGTQ